MGSVVFIANSHLKGSISSMRYMHKVNILVSKQKVRKIFYKNTYEYEVQFIHHCVSAKHLT